MALGRRPSGPRPRRHGRVAAVPSRPIPGGDPPVSAPIVVVTRDIRNRTVVSWYTDKSAWVTGDAFAEIVANWRITAGRVEDIDVANRIADTWLLLIQVPDYDVSYLATHHVVSDLLEPLAGSVA